ncbi:MAG: prepilin-type N-terminal cleavage/methylation domain-containing protein [Candidatus Marinimicrobia bacterium]|nr:prepilin-type N-terminal cleavage/methylation domain-containing protein [Candidatus Neomarinimicrobiota bacterium]MBT4360897.1 prepilin-type N-terminal cleavage/methylation domain-containing protein [Candidatus Neomarinimicrobiota bacterium]MBT4714043.1 prepilin-type N-terminal cleavage/methylation domain-containing protein [Candidatus Neomarinimicrobiota bacterium]MBT4948025.1 prepilin-type N-terminal cleavage/methylation domain-containing protein [Candidatus Neomarinimicrobiota bacterium]M
MKQRLTKIKHSAGLTLVELVTAMVISSIGVLAVGTGITSIVGFYQDDWVTKGARFWGYESMDYIINKMGTAEVVLRRAYLANYDNLLITPKDGSRQLNIQGNKYDGLTVNGQPILDYADFPAEGTYRDEGQRIVALDKFSVTELGKTKDFEQVFSGRPQLNKLEKSLWQIEMIISVTTKYQGESSVEYLTFKRIAWAKDKYFL